MRDCSAFALALLLTTLGLTGCPGSVSTDGIDGFTVRSASWLVLIEGTTRSHALVLASVDGYCSKRQRAESQRQLAFDEHQQRVDGGTSQCESLDIYYDDLARAFHPIEKPNARYMTAVLARDVDSQDMDAITAPAAGHYQQLGGVSDGTFVANLTYHEAKWNQQWADAWGCEDLSEVDQDDPIALGQLLGQVTQEVDFPQTYELSAAEMDIEETGEDKPDVDIDGDILEGSTSIGNFDASFTATKCEVELADQLNL